MILKIKGAPFCGTPFDNFPGYPQSAYLLTEHEAEMYFLRVLAAAVSYPNVSALEEKVYIATSFSIFGPLTYAVVIEGYCDA